MFLLKDEEDGVDATAVVVVIIAGYTFLELVLVDPGRLRSEPIDLLYNGRIDRGAARATGEAV